MRKSTTKKEIIAALGLLLVLLVLSDPFRMYYSNMTLTMLITIVVLVYILFSVVLLKSKPRDEREETHQYLSSRAAYLMGVTVLTVAVIAQSITDMVEGWILVALLMMIVTKIVVQKWSERFH